MLPRFISYVWDVLKSNIEEEDGIYRFEIDDFIWYIPYNDIEQGKWCRDFLQTHERYLDYVSEGDIILEAGAATGEYTVEAAHRIGGSGRLITFEAEPLNFKSLTRNIMLYDLENITTEHMALSKDGTEQLSFEVTGTIADHRVDAADHQNAFPDSQDSNKTIEVASTTIDEYCNKNNIDHIDMLKITVNGHEGEILRGAKEMLPDTHYVFSNYPYEDVVSLLNTFGFEIVESRDHESTGNPHLWVNPSFTRRK